MTGRGGGNFYVLVLIAAGQVMHEAATSAQFILMLTALAGMLVFQKSKTVDWKLALVIDPPTDIMALVGGYYSNDVSNLSLKWMLSGLLVVAGLLMLVKVKERPLHATTKNRVLASEFPGSKLCRKSLVHDSHHCACGFGRRCAGNLVRLIQGAVNGLALRCPHADCRGYIFGDGCGNGSHGVHWPRCSRAFRPQRGDPICVDRCAWGTDRW
jgi:hypothetical protein